MGGVANEYKHASCCYPCNEVRVVLPKLWLLEKDSPVFLFMLFRGALVCLWSYEVHRKPGWRTSSCTVRLNNQKTDFNARKSEASCR